MGRVRVKQELNKGKKKDLLIENPTDFIRDCGI